MVTYILMFTRLLKLKIGKYGFINKHFSEYIIKHYQIRNCGLTVWFIETFALGILGTMTVNILFGRTFLGLSATLKVLVCFNNSKHTKHRRKTSSRMQTCRTTKVLLYIQLGK